MLLGHCCICTPKVDVNFKAFDFADGTLLWNKLLYSPVVGLNGDVYSVVQVPIVRPGFVASTKSSGHTTVTLKSYAEIVADPESVSEFRIARSDGATGATTTLGDPIMITTAVGINDVTGIMGVPFNWGGFHSSKRPVDNAHQFHGWMDTSLNGQGVNITSVAESTAGDITYHITAWTQDETIRIVTASGSFGSAVTIDFATDDTIGDIETAISTALGARATVTATGFPPRSGILTLSIQWADEDDHFETATVASRVGIWSRVAVVSTVTGEVVAESGRSVMGGSFIGNQYDAQAGVFSDNGELLLLGKHNTPAPFSSLVYRLYSIELDPSWTVSWSEDTIHGDNFVATKFDLVYARNGIVILTSPMPTTIVHALASYRSVRTLSEDGTGSQDMVDYAQGYANVCVLDDDTDVAVRSLYDYSLSEDVNHDANDDYFGGGYPSSLKVIDPADGTTSAVYETGEFAGPHEWVNGAGLAKYRFAMFACVDSTGAAWLQRRAFGSLETTYGTHLEDSVILSSRADDQDDELTNRGWIFQTVVNFNGSITDQPPRMYIHTWQLVNPVGANMGAIQPRWKLRWVANSGAATQRQTDWFDYDDDETVVNTELESVWGVNDQGGPNCQVDPGVTYNDSGTGQDLVVPQMPFWCQGLILKGYGPTCPKAMFRAAPIRQSSRLNSTSPRRHGCN